MKAMIFAAGLGTRLRPLTNNRPKALVEVNGKPLLELAILRLIQHGFDEIVINIHHFGQQIIDFLDQKQNFNIQIHISDERGNLLETGGGLKKAKHFFKNDEAFLVCNADIITDLDLNKFYHFHLQQNAVASLAVRNRHTSRYLLFQKEDHILIGWENEKTGAVLASRSIQQSPINWAFSGMHVISPKLFHYFPEDQDAFSIIDTYLEAAKTEKIVAYPHNDSIWLDVGKPESLAEAQRLILDL